MLSKIKMGVCAAFMSLSLVIPLHAQVNAKDVVEKTMKSLGAKQAGFTYNCQGNEAKASCVAHKLTIDNEVSLTNIKIGSTIRERNLDTTISFNIDYAITPGFKRSKMEVLPKYASCASFGNVDGILYKGSYSCDITAPIYTIKLKSAGGVESKLFANKDIAVINEELEKLLENIETAPKEKLQQFAIDPKELTIEFKGARLGDKILTILKEEDPTYTKEQYEAAINMGATMIPLSLANAKATESTITQATKAASAISDVLTSKKSQAIITFKRKSSTMLNLADLPEFLKTLDDPMMLIQYLEYYNISVVSR